MVVSTCKGIGLAKLFIFWGLSKHSIKDVCNFWRNAVNFSSNCSVTSCLIRKLSLVMLVSVFLNSLIEDYIQWICNFAKMLQ